MKNTLFIFPQSHLRVWLLCQDASPADRKAKKDKARLHNLLSVLLIFSLFWGLGEDVCNYIVPKIYFFRFQNKLCVASQKPDLGSQCFSTFSFLKGCTWITMRKKWRQRRVKFKNVVRNKREKEREKKRALPPPSIPIWFMIQLENYM